MLNNRALIAALLALWLAIGPVGTAWAAYSATPCPSMSGMSQPLPAGENCCGDAMDASACLSACIAAAPVAAAPAMPTAGVEALRSAIPGVSLRYATILAPPDVAPPKTSVS